MRQLGILLVLVLLSLGGSVRGEEELRQEKTGVPLGFLIFPGSNDLEAEFGFEVVEELHLDRMRCDIKNRKEELKFTDKQDHMMKYFRHTKQVLSFPEFEELASENKKDLETNFKKAFREMEMNHFRKLSRMQVYCDQVVQTFMEERLRRVMNYANTLLQADVSKFTQLMSDMTEYQGQLQRGLSECITFAEENSKAEHFERAGLSFDLCYGNEVVILIKFVTNFTRLAEELMQKMYKNKNTEVKLIKIVKDPPKKPPEVPPTPKQSPNKEPPTTEKVQTKKPEPETKLPVTEGPDQEAGDDEDMGNGSGSGSGRGQDDDKSPPTEEPTKSFAPITREKSTHKKPTPSPLTTSNHAKTEPTKPSKTITISDKEKKPTTESKLDAAQEFFNNLEPGPVIIDPVTPEEDTPAPKDKPLSKEEKQVAEDAFETVEKMQEAAERKPEEGRRGESQLEPEEKDPSLSIDLDLPAVDAGVDVQIGPNGVQISPHSGDEQEIVFEEVVTTTAATHDSHHHRGSFKVQFLIYFFATLGILLALALIALLVVLVRLRVAKPEGSSKDPPLLSEQEKIAVMKKSGYVNPTYQFFDEVKDV